MAFIKITDYSSTIAATATVAEFNSQSNNNNTVFVWRIVSNSLSQKEIRHIDTKSFAKRASSQSRSVLWCHFRSFGLGME